MDSVDEGEGDEDISNVIDSEEKSTDAEFAENYITMVSKNANMKT